MGKWNMKWRWAYFGAARDARTTDLGGMLFRIIEKNMESNI